MMNFNPCNKESPLVFLEVWFFISYVIVFLSLFFSIKWIVLVWAFVAFFSVNKLLFISKLFGKFSQVSIGLILSEILILSASLVPGVNDVKIIFCSLCTFSSILALRKGREKIIIEFDDDNGRMKTCTVHDLKKYFFVIIVRIIYFIILFLIFNKYK